MPRFTIKDLLLSTTIVAIGVAFMIAGYKHASPIWVVAWPIIGAGVALPFRKAAWGAAIGTMMMVAWIAAQFVRF